MKNHHFYCHLEGDFLFYHEKMGFMVVIFLLRFFLFEVLLLLLHLLHFRFLRI